ncbi:lipase family alpha/beta hydrolase [Cardinium endosymbiont of Bemisia tabaci]|uniref:lipase family alpha/beta hydrolase n=1 Tax=Cardinium endosymbiont of Bemisia tabaci TaxID=672794 RepID=UPI000442D2C7|nr:alpha/beta hydrolase [Cardinium endosymbiont of Bemisia tabaci]CDG49537.1 Alpha/beta hydrolase domain-containing protein [Cardinium endosymbiont cBtQ1 of Bemisia tabaci]
MSYIFYRFPLVLFFLFLFPNFVQGKLDKRQSNTLIILFHGLGNHAASFNTMKEKLEQAFPAVSVVALSSVEGMKSISLSIEEQSAINFEELSTKVEDLAQKSIILIGHSQGGLRAYAFLRKYEHLNIKGLVALATPWEGVPGARVDAEMLAHHLTVPVLNDLRELSLDLGYAQTDLEKQLILNVQDNQSVCLFPGGKDLIEGSAFLREVKKSLPNVPIPILAIGGGQTDFSALLTSRKRYRFKALNDMYTFFVVGKKHLNQYHDMQIPLYSQHAFNMLPKAKCNFKRVLIKDAFHSTHVLKIPVPKYKSMLEHPAVLHAVIQFAKTIVK